MSYSALLKYIHGILGQVPWAHWAVMILVPLLLMFCLFIYRKRSAYYAVVFGITVFVALFLLETAVVIRYCGLYPHGSGSVFKVGFDRFFHGSEDARSEFFSNLAVFVPFGFFLSESLSSARRLGDWRRIGCVSLAGFGLSLCIECLQLILHVGFFELMDLVLNTAGAYIGAVLSVLGRMAFGIDRNKTS